MAPNEPHRFVDFTLDSNDIQLKNSHIYSNNYNAVIAPRCSRVRKHSIDQKIEKLERQTPKNST